MATTFGLCALVGCCLMPIGRVDAARPWDTAQLPASASFEHEGGPPRLRNGAGEKVPGFLWASGRLRLAGRRSRDEELELANSPGLLPRWSVRLTEAVGRWLLGLALGCLMLLAAPCGVKAAPPPPHVQDGEPGTDAAESDAPENEPLTGKTRVAGHRQRSRKQPTDEGEGAFPRHPYYGMPNVVVNDPAQYPHPPSTEVNDPNSFCYTMRPNIFNIPVDPEWDFYNLINTDRPDFTDAVYSVGKGVTYLENGFTFTKINTFDEHISTRQLPESLLRHGLTDEFELRLKWSGYLMTRVDDPRTGFQQNTFGSEDIDVGFKYEVFQQHGWQPMTTVDGGLVLPTGSPGTTANFVQPHFNILMGWGFRRWLYLKEQTGCDFVHTSGTQVVTPLSGGSNPTFVAVRQPPNSWHESLSLLTQWTKRVGAFHEWFMISPTGGGHSPAQHFLDMGLYIYATPNVQFDVRVGRQLSNQMNDFFTGAGFSGRW